MNAEKDILEKAGKVSYGVPDGYFDDLKARLASIPEKETVSPGVWMRLRPYLALAACFAAILLIGNSVLRNTAFKRQPADQYLNEPTFAEIITLTHPEAIFDALEYEHEDLSEEDIINYLIESGATMEQLAYAGGKQE